MCDWVREPRLLCNWPVKGRHGFCVIRQCFPFRIDRSYRGDCHAPLDPPKQLGQFDFLVTSLRGLSNDSLLAARFSAVQ